MRGFPYDAGGCKGIILTSSEDLHFPLPYFPIVLAREISLMEGKVAGKYIVGFLIQYELNSIRV